MAAGDYTVYDNSQSQMSGNITIVGQSAATAAALTHYVGFLPSRITFYHYTDTTTPVKEQVWYRGLATSATTGVSVLNTYGGGSGDELTVDTTNEILVSLETSGSYEGKYKIVIDKDVQANSEFYTIIIER
jgi:hypothetical protein